MPVDLVDAVLASGASLPSPGLALPRLQAAAADEQAGLREYARAVADDPAVSAALMRVANSPVFRPPSQSKTVEQAVAVLGLARTVAVTANVALKGQLDNLPAAQRSAIAAVLDAAGRAAELAYRAARASRQRRLADGAYLAALMQDCGLVVLARRGLPFSPPFGALTDGHAAIGGALLRNWKMPAEIAAAVAVHHAPREAAKGDGDAADLAVLMACGRYLMHGDAAEWEAWSAAAAALGLGPAEIAALQAD